MINPWRWLEWHDLTPSDLYHRVKWFWQRGTRGWADRDTWSFDWYLSGVIAGGLKHLAGHTHGYPCEGPVMGMIRNLTSEEREKEKEEEDNRYEEWKHTLREIVDGFEFHRYSEDVAGWDYSREQELEQRLNHSLALFSKWYRALWD